MHRATWPTMLVLSLCTQAVSAQVSPGPLEVGRTIRIHRHRTAVVSGTLMSQSADSLVLADAGAGTVAVSLSDVTGIEVQDGTRSDAGRGAVKGLVIGAGAGLLFGAVSAAAADWYVEPGQLILYSTLGGAAFGSATGALIGATSHSPRWVPIVTPTAMAQPDGAAGKGVALGLHFEF